ncbi:MAG: transcriptional regulator, partial [Pseudomonadota bacterium]
QKGRELGPVMMALAQWGDKWAQHKNGRPFFFVDPKTGGELPRIWPRRENGEELKLSDVEIRQNEDFFNKS